MKSSRDSYGAPAKSSPRKRSTRPFIMLDEAVFDELRSMRQVPETLLVTLLSLKYLIGSRAEFCVYDPRHPDSSLYVRLEELRHRAIATLQEHLASLWTKYELIDMYYKDDGRRYLRLVLPDTPVPEGRTRAPFIRIDLGLMRYCRFLVRCVLPKNKQGWETVFVSWVALKRFENRVSGLCCPSYDTLSVSRGRHPLTMMRHVRVLILAGVINRHWNHWPTRRGKTRYKSNHYTLLAPTALLRVEQGEVVCINRSKLIPNPDGLNQIENRGLDKLEEEEEKALQNCIHTRHHALPYPMWQCRVCGDIFQDPGV